MQKFATINKIQTQKLGEMLARELRGACLPTRQGKIICLSGDLGSGKTTFTQGLLKGLKVKGPYTSPTFLIMKHYKKEFPISKSQYPKKFKILNIYHLDAYRVKVGDILDLGWKEIVADNKNIIIIEWAERVKKIIPKDALWIKFKWIGKNEREIRLGNFKC